MALESILITDLPHLPVTLDLFDAHLHSAVCLSTLESWMLPGKPLAISINCKLYPTTTCILIKYLCFRQWSYEIACAINCTNNLRGFAFIFCFKHLNSNRYFDASLRELHVVNGNLDNFLTREKSFILDFSTVSEHISAESSVCNQTYSSRGISKDSFSKSFFWCLLNSYIESI